MPALRRRRRFRFRVAGHLVDDGRYQTLRKTGHETHHNDALSVEELAEVAGLSPRQFSRAFRAETGQSPAKAVEHLRVEAARLLLEKGRLTLDVIAGEVGFSDRERMRRAFLRTIGQPPQAVRRFSRETRGTVGSA